MVLGLPRLPQEAEIRRPWAFKWVPVRRVLLARRALRTGGRMQPRQDSHGLTAEYWAPVGADAWGPAASRLRVAQSSTPTPGMRRPSSSEGEAA